MKTDVLVVGAGPVGLTMAAELARYGISVRIVEKAAQATDKSKALVIWSRTLELIDRMGCTPSFTEAGHRVTAATITAGGSQIAHVTLGGVDSPYPYALMIPQSDTERLMAQHLNSLGVTVERTVELTSFLNVGSGVQSILRHADGREETVETSWLIGCDGAHSTVRHHLGMEFLGNTLTSDWVLADVHLSNVPNDEIKVMWHAEGVLVIFPIVGDRFRVVADAGIAKDGPKRADPTMEEVQAILDQRGPGGITASDPIWLAAFRINERKVEDYRKGRVFLAGDAAHVHSPAGGQGMNTGMQDACNLAWKLALACRGCTESPLLDSYSEERSAVGDQVLKGAGHITMIATMRGGVKQAIRNHVASLIFGLAPVREAMAEVMTELSIAYPHSPITSKGSEVHDGPYAGHRAPLRADEAPVGAGNTPRFAIFAEENAEATALLTKYPKLIEPKLRKPFAAGGIWVVRPDGYIAVATKQGDWERVSEFFASIA
ncbi:MAG: FAD-dependent monooxygenase [Chthoniobacterales bacterium]